MEFSDQGLIINIKRYSENDAIVKIFSNEYGICRGFVKKIDAKRNRSIFQIGNLISFQWKSRNEDGLGSFYYCDVVKSYFSKILFNKFKLNCFSSIFSIIDNCFLEREEHQDLYLEIIDFLRHIVESDNKLSILQKYIIIEVKILEVMGYGIDLSCCASSGEVENLVYVSPRSGRAVSKEAGQPYHDKLLKLPQFLLDNFCQTDQTQEISKEEIENGLDLSGYFLEKFIFSQSKSSFSSRESIQKELTKLA